MIGLVEKYMKRQPVYGRELNYTFYAAPLTLEKIVGDLQDLAIEDRGEVDHIVVWEHQHDYIKKQARINQPRNVNYLYGSPSETFGQTQIMGIPVEVRS